MFESRFIYSGSAAGFGANFQRVDENPALAASIPVQGASCLPVTGGISSSQYGGFRYPADADSPLVFIGRVTTDATTSTRVEERTGGQKASRAAAPPPVFETAVAANISDLRLIKRINAGEIRVKLKSAFGPKQRYANIVPEEAVISGLVIDGHNVDVTIDLSPFREHPTKRALGLHYALTPRFRKANWERFNADNPRTPHIPHSKGLYLASVVSKITIADQPPDVKVDRNYRIIWPGIGTIILGEMIIGDYFRRLTMLRCQFGSPVGGDASAGDVQSNGVMMP
jgi:hypothetical protein